MTALGAAEFGALLDGLGPFEPSPRLAVAVSGGADSLALALLAEGWARARNGDAVALIVDHGLRAESAAEAALTRQRLAGRGIVSSILPLPGLRAGPGLAARARTARYAALHATCAAAGRLHLLLGHHAADQAETVAMRLLAGSGPHGLAAMPALLETPQVRLLRPLLTVPPVRLRDALRVAGLDWIDDPSNADPAAQRARLRIARRDRDGSGPVTLAAVAAAAARGWSRAADERRVAALLARRATLAPEGFGVVSHGALPPDALAALLRTISGGAWPPAPAQVADLAGALRPATLAGVQVMPAGRLCPGGWLLVREAAAMAAPVPACPGVWWDRRFQLAPHARPPDDAAIGALGADAAALRGWSDLPSAVLRTLPAVRLHGKLAVVPQLDYPDAVSAARCAMRFTPASAAGGAAFLPPPQSRQACVIEAPG